MRLPGSLLILATVALFQSTRPAFGQSQAITDEAIPTDIVLRLLAPGDFLAVEQLVVGQLPDNFPTEFPLPDDTVIVAGVAYRFEVFDTELYRILLDVPQSPDVLLDQYQVQLEASGWMESVAVGDSGGFVSSAPSLTNSFLFCENGEEMSLNFLLTAQQNNLTSLDLNLLSLSEEDTRCDPETSGLETEAADTPMPLLQPPAEAVVQLGGRSFRSSTGDNEGTTAIARSDRATIESELASTAIAQHYATQWEEAGWILSDRNESDGTIQSFWMFEDETGNTWQGTLTIEPVREESGKYEASASVELMEEPSSVN